MSAISEAPSPNIILSEEWCNAAKAVAYDSVTSTPPVALVCGPKNSGKTTFSRYLVNILLQRYKKVAYLDTDVGQAEFTPPGCLSLTVINKVTPDLTIPCLKTPERCFFFGDISSKKDPIMYLRYISGLYDYYQKEFCLFNQGCPLVVNTPGWVKGVGYDRLVGMVKYIGPTHVVKICISVERKNLPAGAFWLDEGDNTAASVIEINSARQDSLNRSVLVQKHSGLIRDLRIMAYFRQCFPSDNNITTIKELARALTSLPPYEISTATIEIKHLHCKVPKTKIFYSLNATIVGLAISADDSEGLSPCVGLGIVRAVDAPKRLLYIITPVPQNTMENVNLLLQGFIQIPICLLQVPGCVSPYMSKNVSPLT